MFLLLAVFAVTTPAEAAITFVQGLGTGGTGGAIGTTATVTTTGTVTAGNSILVFVATNNGADTITCSDPVNGTYTTDVNNGGLQTAVCSKHNALALPAGSSVTITVSPFPTNIRISVAEFAGLATTSTLDGSIVANGIGTSPTVTLGATTQAYELLIGVVNANNLGAAVAFTPGTNGTVNNCTNTGTTTYEALPSASGQNSVFPIFCIVEATGAYQARGSFTTSQSWTVAMATYRGGLDVTSTSVSPSAATVTYATAQTFTATVTTGGVAVTAGTVTFTDTSTATTLASNVALDGSGQAAVTVTLGAGGHTIQATYNPDIFHAGSSNTTSVTVNRRTLTVSANTLIVTYGAAPTLTSTITGFVNGDPPTVVTGAPSLTHNGTLTNGRPNAGTWSITGTAGTLAAANYSFLISSASLIVNRAPLTVTANALTIPYGATPSFTASLTGFVNSDTSSVVSGTASFTTNATMSGGVPNSGSWTITPAAGTLAAANYTFAFVTGTLTVGSSDQTISFGALGPRIFGGAPFTVGASASSDLPVRFASLTTSVCTVSGNTVTIVSAGTCVIAADQSGDASYAAAPQVTRSFTVAKADQTISFPALSNKMVGDAAFTVSATAAFGLPVTFSSTTTSVCMVSGNTVTIVGPGTCTVAADQAGTANFNPAPRVSRSFTVALDCSSITIGPAQLPSAVGGLPYSQALTLSGGAAIATLDATGTLPPGLTFNGGVLSGSPTTRGVYTFNVSGTDTNGCQASKNYSLAISAERRLLAGAGAGGGGSARAFNLASVTPVLAVNSGSQFAGGVAVAEGDVDGNGVADVITGAGPGAGPAVTVFDGGTATPRLAFLAFPSAFTGGVEVAAGDVTGDGIPEVLAAQGCGSGSTSVVRAFDGRTGALVREYAVNASISGCGLHVTAGDVNGDGVADLVVGSAGLGPSFVRVIDGSSGAPIREFFPYTSAYAGGVYVAAGDVTGDGFADIVTGAGPGGAPHVRVFDGVSGNQIAGTLGSFLAYPTGFSGGVRVAAGDLNGDGRAEVVTGAGPGGGPHVRVFDGATTLESFGLFAFDPTLSGVFVAAPVPSARMNVDIAAARTTGTDVRIAGWALRDVASDTVGNDAIHVWALPVSGGSPLFVGAAPARVARPDVAAFFGGEFLMSGFDFSGTLAPGTYDLLVYARNTRTLKFDQVRVVRVTVP